MLNNKDSFVLEYCRKKNVSVDVEIDWSQSRIIFVSPSNSEEQIVYLDLGNVVKNTKAGKSILSKLENSKKSALLEFEKKEKDLKKIEEEKETATCELSAAENFLNKI